MIRLRAAAIPLAVFILALIPRLIDLGSRPFWLDEVFTDQRASLPFWQLVQNSFENHHMPSYFLLLSPLVSLGDPQFWLRLPSAIFGAVAVVLVFVIARRVAGTLAGVLAALVIGLSPTALAFSQEARSYTLEMALILVALYGVLRLSGDLPAACKPIFSRGARLGWALFVIASAVALDILGDGLPWILTANVILLVLLARAPAPGALLRNLAIADALIALCCAPFYALMLRHQGSGFIDSVMWIPPLDAARLWYDLGSVYFMRVADSVTFRFMAVPTPLGVTALIELGLAVSVLTAGWVLRRRPAALAVLAIACLFLPVTFTVISIWRPILLPRYILWSSAPFAILAGIGAAALLRRAAPRWRMAAVGATCLLLLANMAPYYQVETKPRWDVAAQMLSQEVRPGDVVYLYDLGALPILKLYLPKHGESPVLAETTGELTHALQSQAAGRRVWVVYGHAGQSGLTQQWAQFYAQSRALGTPKKLQVAGKRIFIALYAPPPAEHMAQNCPVGQGIDAGC